ncbi:hypothetical protein AB4097_19260 [Microvirga sp. 2MCAF35]|uniref:hypothetical protein n=1 Tax=Microvirga sp. 2MCAF35 TaxID=3232987 RepID=UPI003F9BED46
MNRFLLTLGILVASALLIPGDAEARRHGGGGARVSAGGHRMAVHRGGAGYHRVGRAGGGYRQAAIRNPGGRYGYRAGNGRYYGNRYYGGRYYAGRSPYYGGSYGRYPYYRGWGAAGLATGAVVGAAATYPYYNYPYSTYQTPISSAVGGSCVTAVRTCTLTNSASVGTGCSCRTSGGRARGTVQ